MSEVMYNLFLFMMIIIFFNFGFIMTVKLDYYLKYHSLDFVGINNEFIIKTGAMEPNKINIIYINSVSIPNECLTGNKTSLKCLAKLKSIGGGYNNLFFFTGTNIYK